MNIVTTFKPASLVGLCSILILNYFSSDSFLLGASLGSRGLSDELYVERMCVGKRAKDAKCPTAVSFAVTVANAQCSRQERDTWVCKEGQKLLQAQGEKASAATCMPVNTAMRECTERVIASELLRASFSSEELKAAGLTFTSVAKADQDDGRASGGKETNQGKEPSVDFRVNGEAQQGGG
jgi:hypothetical protein